MYRKFVYLLIMILIITGCSEGTGTEGNSARNDRKESATGALPVEIMEVEEREVVEWIQAVGLVSADKRVTMSAEVGGSIAKIYVNAGDSVSKGDLLARLDDERNRIARDLARAEVEIARANLANSKRDIQRETRLFKDKVTSRHSIDQIALKVKIDEGRLKAVRAALAAAERNLRDSSVFSPMDGKITRKHIEVGELVGPGTPLFDIINIDRVKVTVHIPERDITRMHKGMDAEIYADGYPGIAFKGTVNTIVVEADPLTLTFPVEIMVVNNRPEKLLPGFICRVKIRGKVFKQAIFLSQEVVVRRDGHSVIFVAAGDTVSARIVETGFTNRGKILIKKGIKPGDRIVLVGQEALQDGTRIRIR